VFVKIDGKLINLDHVRSIKPHNKTLGVYYQDEVHFVAYTLHHLSAKEAVEIIAERLMDKRNYLDLDMYENLKSGQS